MTVGRYEPSVASVREEEDATEFNIFYHIFFPADQDGIERSIAIVEEQIGLIRSSYPGRVGGRTIVHYNTIGGRGEENPLNSTFMDQLCESNRIKCEHMQHYQGGDEYLTLTRGVYDFCQTVSDKSTRVAYIHSKGSRQSC
jgi:hypothetical protein